MSILCFMEKKSIVRFAAVNLYAALSKSGTDQSFTKPAFQIGKIKLSGGNRNDKVINGLIFWNIQNVPAALN